MSLSKRARQFQDLLHSRGADVTVVELPGETRTAEDAARTLGCRVEQIVKSLLFRSAATGAPVLVLVSGRNRVDLEKLAATVGEPLVKADAAYVKRVTGYAIGGVPPTGHRSPSTVLVDQDLLTVGETWAAAGTPHAVFKVPGVITDILDEHLVVPVT
jgi:prolyl-tRNA editing enzyme YbaK/EbsC (Cys-tRNA(Pro) deacylase)